jgi:c(7)-type cytochrome triheme protein
MGWAMVATAVASIVGCSTAASVFLDLPEQREQPAVPIAATTSLAAPPQDTVRPPIESTLSADSALALLPKDAAGDVDWVAALRSGVVRPRRGLPGVASPSGNSDFGYDFRLRGPNEMFDALFPHSSHVEWMACDACHPSIFPYRGAPISMKEINEGDSCGRCHGTVAFPASTCSRCHPAMPAPSPRQTQLSHDILPARAGSDSTSPSGEYPRARFAHWVHRVRYQCSACHPQLFDMRAGSDTLTMSAMQKGEACGACHDGDVAFSLLNCTTCHATPAGGEEGP